MLPCGRVGFRFGIFPWLPQSRKESPQRPRAQPASFPHGASSMRYCPASEREPPVARCRLRVKDDQPVIVGPAVVAGAFEKRREPWTSTWSSRAGMMDRFRSSGIGRIGDIRNNNRVRTPSNPESGKPSGIPPRLLTTTPCLHIVPCWLGIHSLRQVRCIHGSGQPPVCRYGGANN